MPPALGVQSPNHWTSREARIYKMFSSLEHTLSQVVFTVGLHRLNLFIVSPEIYVPSLFSESRQKLFIFLNQLFNHILIEPL